MDTKKLRELNERLEAELAEGRRIGNQMAEVTNVNAQWFPLLQKCEAKLVKAVAAIEWYSKPKRYERNIVVGHPDNGLFSDVDLDKGKKATKALAELKGDG